jgi:ASC-1-like (ASCH) protein
MKSHRLVFRKGDSSFEAIRDGRKTVETRAASVRYAGIQKGDTLVMCCGRDKFEKTVKHVRHFGSIDDLLAEVPMVLVNPDAESKQDIYKMYQSYPGYEQKIAQHGLMAVYL